MCIRVAWKHLINELHIFLDSSRELISSDLSLLDAYVNIFDIN